MMKKNNIPFGVYNLLLCVLAVVLAMLLCLCAQAAEDRYYLKWDVSDDQLSVLSDYTLNRLSALQEDVVIYPVYHAASGTLKDLQTETLLKLAAECPHVSVETIDANTQPQRLANLAGESTGIEDGTIFVRCPSMNRTIRLNPDDFLFSRRLGDEIYTIYCGEAQLIGAIDRVAMADPVSVWFVTGHGEADEESCAQWALWLKTMGYAVRTGNLGMMSPDSQDVLMILAPQSDLTASEADTLMGFLDAGGRLLIACGTDTPFNRLTHLMNVMELYGLGWRAGWVVEDEGETAFYVDRPELLSPVLADSSVMEEQPGRLILPRSCALQSPSLRPGITNLPLLTTSSAAMLKQNTSGDAYTFEEGDVSGTMLLALMASSGDMRILQLASADMLLDEQPLTGTTVLDASENLNFLAACLESMTGTDGSATLDAGIKQLPAQLITFDNQATQQRVSLLLITALPATTLLVMIVVLVKRRRL